MPGSRCFKAKAFAQYKNIVLFSAAKKLKDNLLYL
jgi:hypothetical protein